VWNADYRGSDVPFPATFQDAAALLDHLPASRYADRLDLDRVAGVGHSAGGQLALWLAGRPALPADAPGAATGDSVRLRLVVGQAPVADLVEGFRDGLGGGAVEALMDATPQSDPDRYRLASPQTLPAAPGTRVLLVHGTADQVVPLSQSEGYARAAAARSAADVRLEVVEGAGHFEHLDPASAALDPVLGALSAL
jgi:pimeloyl-ACP methyl ester carboxylesterase